MQKVEGVQAMHSQLGTLGMGGGVDLHQQVRLAVVDWHQLSSLLLAACSLVACAVAYNRGRRLLAGSFYAHSTSLLSDHASALTVVIIIAARRLPAPRRSSTLYVQPSSFASSSRRLRSCRNHARVRSVASSPASPCARPARCCRALTRAGQEGW